MPLTKRQKRRLKEVSRMIESSYTIQNDMLDMQQEYSSELEEISKLIQTNGHKVEKLDDSVGLDSSISKYEEKTSENKKSDSKKTEGNTNEHKSEENFEPKMKDSPNAPVWAKALWRRIAMKCHPDRLSFDKLSAIDIARRQQWFLDSQKHFETGDWNKLIHIGIQVDEWVDDISYFKQHGILDNQYNIAANKINEIQNSLAWNWGNSWDNLDSKIKIVTVYCQALGLTLPSRATLIEILVNFELE